ncbi:hypothetical protein SAMN05444411_104195 [Lutibacter oricola]|uniref:NADH-quinone oxidoreductase subunit E n=1 Tax=Lutibacter oricola TaxID=762486 RepID=A0A1H3ASE0_9FLAO|nr:hypothetical protein [Lutibacter oricola]SDX31769.1 hypothetical protein SAMN05444411_104195 [Lutibacter oricola]
MTLSVFTNQTFTHLLEIFFWMLGAFLIGLYFGKKFYAQKENPTIDFDQEYEDLQIKDDISQIRATKTFERGGKTSIQTVILDEDITPTQKDPNIENGLNFSRFGEGNENNKSDLKLIKGIGAGIEEKLNSIGIYNFQQISKFTAEDIEKVTELTKFFPGRIDRDNWVGQAKELLKQ